MKSSLIRFVQTERGLLAVLAASIVVPVIGGMLFCQSLATHMLRQDAQATSSEWVSMLVARNPDILTLFSHAAASVQTKHLLDESSQVGDIYRLRIWDTTGNLVFKSERLKSTGAPIVFSEKREANAVAAGAVVNELHQGGPPQNVSYYVESFVPIKKNGVVVGVFDVFLDQSDNEILLKNPFS